MTDIKALVAQAKERVPSGGAIQIAQRGFEAWRAKPHNAKWFKRIDGTPIPNDLVVCVAEQFAAVLASVSALAQALEALMAENERLAQFIEVCRDEERRAMNTALAESERIKDLERRLAEEGDMRRIKEIALEEAFRRIERADRRLADAERERDALRVMLVEVKDRGLIYWEPKTTRGHSSKADMFRRIDAALASVQKQEDRG